MDRFPSHDVSDARLADFFLGKLRHLVGRRMAEEEVDDAVLTVILTALDEAESTVGHVRPRAGDARLLKVVPN